MPQEALVVFQSPVGTYHVEHHGAGVHAVFFKPKRGKKAKIIANTGSMEAALRRISYSPTIRASRARKVQCRSMRSAEG